MRVPAKGPAAPCSAGAGGSIAPPAPYALNRDQLANVRALVALAAFLAFFAIGCGSPRTPGGGPPTEGGIGGALDCRGTPPFAASLGFEAGTALTTGHQALSGLVLVDVRDPGRTYQHPSWTDYGALGPFTFDAMGTIFVAPTPNLSLLDNPPEEQNTILRVDSESGEMAEFVRLEPGGPLSAENPFGILGLTYDCDTRGLYAASVAGSTRGSELGRIVRISPEDGAVLGELPGVDAMGVAVFQGSLDRRLYYGSARRPEIWSIALDERGGFVGAGAPRREVVLPEWSDRARRIVFDAEGGMEIRAVPFAFTLAVGLDSPENVYGYRYDPGTDTWREEAGL